MKITARLQLAGFPTVLKIGIAEILYALNFSNFSYARISDAVWLSYPLAVVSVFLFYFLATYLQKPLQNARFERPLFTVAAAVIFTFSVALSVLTGHLDTMRDLSTLMSLFTAEITADFAFGYSLCYSGVVNSKS